jgi:uracil-DNA glycosylase family 4
MRLVQTGPRDAKIVIVGEAPGATEEQSGIPFSGGAGEILNGMLSRSGISRSECFVTNVCHVRPPKNEFSWFMKQKPPIDFLQGVLQLKRDLEEIKPNVIIALGTYPLKVTTGKTGIDTYRGSIWPCTLVPGLKVIGTYHPAAILRVWNYKAVAEFDLVRAQKQSLFPEIRRPYRNLILNPPREDMPGLVADLLRAEWLAVDIECSETPSGWRLSCVGFADYANRAVTIPASEPWQLDAIRTLCGSSIKKVLQNGIFDFNVLRNEGIVLNNFAYDTMVGHHMLFAEAAGGEEEFSDNAKKARNQALKKGLGFQTSIYTEEPYYKLDGKVWKETGDLQLYWSYNAKDAAVTREIMDVQLAELKAFGPKVLDCFWESMEQWKDFNEITARGIRVNPSHWAELRKEYIVQLDNLQRALDQLAGESINVKSNKQMVALLYDKLKLAAKRNKKSGNLTADKDAINALAGKYNHPILAIILKIRQVRDFIERYLDVVVSDDGRMRCLLDCTGTNTYRLSSRKSLDGSGTNLQNIPSRRLDGQRIKRGFIPDEGMVFIYRDYSQAEARIVAHLARCEKLIELFDDPNRDIHTENASRIFGVPLGSVTPHQRYQAKRVVHASNYGMGAGRLVELMAEDGIFVSFQEAQTLIDKYFFIYPEIKSVFWRSVENDLRHSRCLETPFGLKRTFYGRWDDKLLRTAYAFIPQSTVGWLGRLALRRLYQELDKKQGIANALLNVHDSILLQCRPEHVEYVAKSAESIMGIPIPINGRDVLIPTDCKVGSNWQDRDKKNPELNPDGLRDLDTWLKEYNGPQTK